MPKVAYSEKERMQIRNDLICTALNLMAKQGFQHTTVEQIYKSVGISRTFFYTFFSSKEDLIIEALYHQQPKLVAYAQQLMADSGTHWRDAVRKFIYSCCNNENSQFAVLSIDEQKSLFRRLSDENQRTFREKQAVLFGNLLESFGIEVKKERVDIFINLCLTIILVHRAIPQSLPFFVPAVSDETTKIQIEAMLDFLEKSKSEWSECQVEKANPLE